MSGKDNIYWDSCIFIAFIKDEDREDPQDMEGIKEIVEQFDLGQITLVTSTITITEVLRSSHKPEEYERFRSLFSRRNFQLIDVTRKIAEISHEIRDYHQPEQQTIATPDAIHLATAIWFKCGVFYTFDGEGSISGLLSLSNFIFDKYNLRIKKPKPTHPPQLSLNL